MRKSMITQKRRESGCESQGSDKSEVGIAWDEETTQEVNLKGEKESARSQYETSIGFEQREREYLSRSGVFDVRPDPSY